MKYEAFLNNPERPKFIFKLSRKEATKLAQDLIDGLLLPDKTFAIQGTACSQVGDKPFIFLRIEVEEE